MQAWEISKVLHASNRCVEESSRIKPVAKTLLLSNKSINSLNECSLFCRYSVKNNWSFVKFFIVKAAILPFLWQRIRYCCNFFQRNGLWVHWLKQLFFPILLHVTLHYLYFWLNMGQCKDFAIKIDIFLFLMIICICSPSNFGLELFCYN